MENRQKSAKTIVSASCCSFFGRFPVAIWWLPYLAIPFQASTSMCLSMKTSGVEELTRSISLAWCAKFLSLQVISFTQGNFWGTRYGVCEFPLSLESTPLTCILFRNEDAQKHRSFWPVAPLLIRGPRMGWICHGWISRFWGALIISPEVATYIF